MLQLQYCGNTIPTRRQSVFVFCNLHLGGVERVSDKLFPKRQKKYQNLEFKQSKALQKLDFGVGAWWFSKRTFPYEMLQESGSFSSITTPKMH